MITLKNIVICVKSSRNLHQIIASLDSNNRAFCIKLQCRMNEIKHRLL